MLGSSGLERTVNGIENLGAETIAVMVTDAIVYNIGSTETIRLFNSGFWGVFGENIEKEGK